MSKPRKVNGPDTAAVEAIVKRANQLTPEEVAGLSAACDAAWVDAYNETYPVAYIEAKDAGRTWLWHAAKRDAWGAAWADRGTGMAGRGAAMCAAGSVAWAAIVRDLVTPEEYAVLAGPWESVVGPVQAAPR